MLWNKPIVSTLDVDRFDLADWQDIIQAIPKIGQADDRAANDFTGRPVQDAFFALKSADPKFADPISTGLTPLADILRRGMETPEWEQLHETSIGDNVAAGVGAHGFVEGVLRNLPQEVKEQAQKAADAQEKADELGQQADDLLEFAKMLAEDGKQEQAEALTQQAGDLQASADHFIQQAQTAAEAAAEAIEANAPQIAAACNRAADAANEKAQETSALVKAYSLAAGGDPSHVDPQMAASAMRVLQNNPNLKALAEMLGWAKRTVRAEWRKSPKGHTTLTGYRTHELQPTTMASGEYVAMVSDVEAVNLDWQRRAADSAVSHRHYEGDEQSGRGPLVMVRDESGSISGNSHALAVALEWALLEIARRDKRDFISVPFSGTGQYHIWEAPKQGKGDWASLEAHLSHFYGGGTEPYAPISAAIAEITGSDKKADIQVITDGYFDQPSEEFINQIKAEKSKRPFKVVTVVIGGSYGEHNAKQFSDRVINIGNLVQDREKLRQAIADVV